MVFVACQRTKSNPMLDKLQRSRTQSNDVQDILKLPLHIIAIDSQNIV